MSSTPLNERIREARKELGLKPIELAYRVGVSERAIQTWEKGTRAPDLNAPKLAKALGRSLDWLLSDEAAS